MAFRRRRRSFRRPSARRVARRRGGVRALRIGYRM